MDLESLRATWMMRLEPLIMRFKSLNSMFSSTTDVYGGLLGVDFADSSLFSIRLRNRLGGISIARAVTAILPSNTITEDMVTNAEALVTALREVAKKSGQVRKAVIAVPGSKVVIKEVKLDRLLDDAGAEAFAWKEARKAFPELAKNLYLDFLQISEEGVLGKQFRLVMVIARKEDVAPRVDALQKAGFVTKIVDVDYYALERVYRLIASQLPVNHAEKYAAVIHFNPRSLLLMIMYQGKAIYFNRQTYVGDVFIPIIENIFSGNITPMPSSLSEEQKTHAVLSIRRLFQSFYTEHSGCVIENIVLLGRCALMTELTDYIAKTLDVPTIVGNPLINMQFDKQLDQAHLLRLGPAFAISCGLAMRGISSWT